MKELELKYGCNPNQKPSKIYMENGELPIKVLCGKPGSDTTKFLTLSTWKQVIATYILFP